MPAEPARPVRPVTGAFPDPDEALGQVLGGIKATYDHVAHALPSIRQALPLYRDLLGGQVSSGGISPWGGHLAIQLRYPGGARIELLEPARPDAPSIGAFLRSRPRGGLHHITFKVPDIASAIAALDQQGFDLVGTYTDLADWKETFMHPRQTGGVLIQLAQAGPGIPGQLARPLDVLLAQAEAGRAASTAGRPDRRHEGEEP